MGVVANMARRVGVMYAGHLVETAELLPLFKQPRHPYTWSLLQSLPRLDAAGRRLQALRGVPPDLINLSEECPFLPRCPKGRDAMPSGADTWAVRTGFQALGRVLQPGDIRER